MTIEIKRCGAQGDVLLRRVAGVPKDAVVVPRENGAIIVTHSETQHHHAIKDDGVAMFEVPGNPLVAYLRMDIGVSADLEHLRPYDTHETLKLLGNKKTKTVWEVRRQREWSPEGWQRVVD